MNDEEANTDSGAQKHHGGHHQHAGHHHPRHGSSIHKHGHRKSTHSRSHKKKPIEQPHLCSEMNLPTEGAASESTNTIPVSLELIGDDEPCPAPSSPSLADTNKIMPQIAIPIRNEDESSCTEPNYDKDSKSDLKSQVMKSVKSLFSNRQRKIDAETKTSRRTTGVISGSAEPVTADNNEDPPLSADGNYTVPTATLVEENTESNKFNWRLLVILVVAAVAAIAVGAGVATSIHHKERSNTEEYHDNDRVKLTPEDVQLMNQFNVWFLPNQIGERGTYYGSKCNALGMNCETCGLYEVDIKKNEVIGACSSCNVCVGNGGFEADCTNLGRGRFNCDHLYEVQPVPVGLNYTHWTCPYKLGSSAVCTGLSGCTAAGAACQECAVHEVRIDTNEVLGTCTSCSVCKAGGFQTDCDNLGFGIFNCYFPEDE